MTITAEGDRQAANDAQSLQELFQGRLRALAEGRIHGANAQATHSSVALAESEKELLAIGSQLPETTGEFATQLGDVRDMIEAQRIKRQEAGNEAARSVEVRLKALRDDLSAETASLSRLKDVVPQRFREQTEALQAQLKEETTQRKTSQQALREVVQRLQVSLEASADMSDRSPAREWRTPR